MKKLLLVLIAVAFVVSFGATQAAYAHSNLLPSVKVGGGWVSVISYIDTQATPAGGHVFVHSTYQMKNPANLLDHCLHTDGESNTTTNDLTTTVLTTPGGGVGTVFPAGDTVGGALIEPAIIATDPISEGFLVIENYDSLGALGPDGSLTTEGIIFNLASGYIFTERGLSTTHLAASGVGGPGNVIIDPPLCGACNYLAATPFSGGLATVFGNTTGGTTTRFIFLPPAMMTKSDAYIIALNRIGTAEATDNAATTNLIGADYQARIGIDARLDAAEGFILGVFNRLEQSRTITQRNDIVCLAELSPAQLVGAGLPTFIVDGGWMNLAARCKETENLGVSFIECNGNAVGDEYGDAALIYKVEAAAGYGFGITPMHQQWYSK